MFHHIYPWQYHFPIVLIIQWSLYTEPKMKMQLLLDQSLNPWSSHCNQSGRHSGRQSGRRGVSGPRGDRHGCRVSQEWGVGVRNVPARCQKKRKQKTTAERQRERLVQALCQVITRIEFQSERCHWWNVVVVLFEWLFSGGLSGTDLKKTFQRVVGGGFHQWGFWIFWTWYTRWAPTSSE